MNLQAQDRVDGAACLESSIALPKKVQLIIYVCKTFIVIFKFLESSIALPKKVSINYLYVKRLQ